MRPTGCLSHTLSGNASALQRLRLTHTPWHWLHRPISQLHTDHGRHEDVLRRLRISVSRTGSLSEIVIIDSLRRSYHEYTVWSTPVMTGILNFTSSEHFDAALDQDLEHYKSLERKAAHKRTSTDDVLDTTVRCGRFRCKWHGFEFPLYQIEYCTSAGYVEKSHFVLWPSARALKGEDRLLTPERLIADVVQHESRTVKDILVYDEGYWKRSSALWRSIQAYRWHHVVLDPALKTQIMDEVEGFFDSEKVYRMLGVPWKRGVIFHGLPGNGKTASIKAIIQSVMARTVPLPALYVKSLGKSCDQDDIRAIFEKARECSPCLLVLEDLDSLVSENVRSCFLNEVDGLERNDGILMVGTTNHHVGVSKRPSRFDRKYYFSLPAMEDRLRYCEVWRTKLDHAGTVPFTSGLARKIARASEGFSFAYLQELFITTMVSLIEKGESCAQPRVGLDLCEDDLWGTFDVHLRQIRQEMLDSRRSIEDSGTNSVSQNARSASPTFGLVQGS